MSVKKFQEELAHKFFLLTNTSLDNISTSSLVSEPRSVLIRVITDKFKTYDFEFKINGDVTVNDFKLISGTATFDDSKDALKNALEIVKNHAKNL